jgi:hypothetical protein
MDSIASIAKPNVNVPIRRAEIFQLASKMRESCGSQPIDIVAEYYGIVLVRMAGPVGRDAGFAYIEFTRRPKYVESLSHPEERVRIWGAWTREPARSIVINTNSGIPEREVFWHEFYPYIEFFSFRRINTHFGYSDRHRLHFASFRFTPLHLFLLRGCCA